MSTNLKLLRNVKINVSQILQMFKILKSHNMDHQSVSWRLLHSTSKTNSKPAIGYSESHTWQYKQTLDRQLLCEAHDYVWANVQLARLYANYLRAKVKYRNSNTLIRSIGYFTRLYSWEQVLLAGIFLQRVKSHFHCM